LQDPGWAGALVDYQVAVNGFVESLRSVSAFDSLLPAMVRILMRTRASFTVIAATGTVVERADLQANLEAESSRDGSGTAQGRLHFRADQRAGSRRCVGR
jgi:hypothetical protein